jgi:hypothetical protein
MVRAFRKVSPRERDPKSRWTPPAGVKPGIRPLNQAGPRPILSSRPPAAYTRGTLEKLLRREREEAAAGSVGFANSSSFRTALS